MKIKPITKNNFFSLFFSFSIILATTGCGNSSSNKNEEKQDSIAENVAPQEEQAPAGGTETFKEFDWNTVPQSSAQIGEFPYLTAPAGFIIRDGDGSDESKTGYSVFKDFDKLIIYNGSSFYNAEGKVAKLKLRMKEENAEWNQYKFDSSVDKYLNSIGAKLLGKLKINESQKAFLNKDNDMTIYNHIVGDPYNEPVRFYALNHPKGKIMFQVFSNSASGEIGVVALEAFEQTIKAPTAAQMKKDIDEKGKAVLNINFDTDKATLQSEGQKVADEILTLMKNNPSLKIAIEGHTDNAGTAEHNKKLSAERAGTILKFLTGQGIAANRLTATGYGAERPLVANDSEINKAKNRRVELVKK